MKSVFHDRVQSGRVHRPRRDIENEEIQMYLAKLKDLVPFMPKNRKLSKLEVIQHVIDYICELQYALDTNPSVNSEVVQASAAALMRSVPGQTTTPHCPVPRQPLGVLNILPASSPEPSSPTVSSKSYILRVLWFGVVICKGNWFIRGREMKRIQQYLETIVLSDLDKI